MSPSLVGMTIFPIIILMHIVVHIQPHGSPNCEFQPGRNAHIGANAKLLHFHERGGRPAIQHSRDSILQSHEG